MPAEHLSPKSWVRSGELTRFSCGAQYYTHLELPLDADEYLNRLDEHLKKVTEAVDRRVPQNNALTIDREKAEFHLAALKAAEKPDATKS